MEMDLCTKALSEHYILTADVVFSPAEVGSNMYILSTGQCRYIFEYCKGMKVSSPGLQNFHGGRRASGFMDLLGLPNSRRQSLVEKVESHVRQETTVRPGDVVSEQSLWIHSWTHQGKFNAETEGWLLTMQAESLHKVGEDHPNAMVEMVLYARNYVVQMNANFDDGYIVSDLAMSSADEDAALESIKVGMFPKVSTSFKPLTPAEEVFAATGHD